MSAPQRTADQRMEALRLAQSIRSQRARWKQQQRETPRAAGAQAAADLISDMPGWAHTMPVRDIVTSVRGIGRERARRLLTAARVGPHRATLAGIGQERRQLLAQHMMTYSAHAARTTTSRHWPVLDRELAR